MCLAVSLVPIGIIGVIHGFYSTITIMLIGLIVVVTLVFSFILAYFISKPIEKLTKNIDEISKGNLKVKLENTEIYEVNELIDSLNTVMASLKLAINKVGVKKEEMLLEDKWSDDDNYSSFFIFDEQANILDCNKNMYKRLGYSKAEMLSMNMTDFDALESKEDLTNKIDEAKKSGSIDFKTIHKRKDGSAVLVHENLLYLKDKNMFKCIVKEE